MNEAIAETTTEAAQGARPAMPLDSAMDLVDNMTCWLADLEGALECLRVVLLPDKLGAPPSHGFCLSAADKAHEHIARMRDELSALLHPLACDERRAKQAADKAAREAAANTPEGLREEVARLDGVAALVNGWAAEAREKAMAARERAA